MTDNSGALSIDFLVGFTIFILAFIWVATLIPNLFLGLSAHTIDYDAVAYRTGVILAEDPGDVSAAEKAKPYPRSWETLDDPGKPDISRFGLAISKDVPNVLSEEKVKRFFNHTAFTYPADYAPRVIFGDYPYRFNISLTVIGDNTIRTVGDIIPQDHSYGYIRRDVKIKGGSNATINASPVMANQACVTFNQYAIIINSSELLYDKVRDPSIQIIPQSERIVINITNLTDSMNKTLANPTEVNLTRIQIFERQYNNPALTELLISDYENISYVNGSSTPRNPPFSLGTDKTAPNNLTLIFEPRRFSQISDTSTIFINLTFGIDPAQEYMNSSWASKPFNYTYVRNANGTVTAPALKEGVLEVAVW